MSLNRSEIEWTEFTINPIRGECPHFGTPVCGYYCYAKSIWQKQGYGDPVFVPEVLDSIKKRKKCSTIYIGSTIDIWANEIPHEWRVKIIETVQLCRQHKYIFLTKNPVMYQDFKCFPYVWYGATVDRQEVFVHRAVMLSVLKEHFKANTFISLEPLLSAINKNDLEYAIGDGLDSIIIGAQTGENVVRPERQWVLDILEVADNYKIKVFLKDNLLSIYPDLPRRRELPWRMG